MQASETFRATLDSILQFVAASCFLLPVLQERLEAEQLPNYMTKCPSRPAVEEPRVIQPTRIIHNGFGGVGDGCTHVGNSVHLASCQG
jgi:hypothetical protein